MIHKLLLPLILAGMVVAAPVYAGDFMGMTDEDGKKLSWEEKREKWKSMSEEERQAFREKRREKWEAMSKEEKIELIEKRRAERMQHRQEKWNSMTDDEKIEFVEKRMKRHHKHGKKWGKQCDHENGHHKHKGRDRDEAE